MPTIAPNTDALVLVSGANGYIAMHVVRVLLEKGYRVRGTVRSEAKIAHVKETFKQYGDKLEVVVVGDITADGAFDEAVKGVDAVEHTASPFNTQFDDPQEAIGPAVHGTTSIINSVLKHGTAVKRVIITSSCAAVLHVADKPIVFSEKDWNEQAWKDVEENGRKAHPMQKYRASKTLAEKAAWKLWESNKSTVAWDLVTLNPPFVFGPVIHEVKDSNSLNTSMQDFWDSVIKGTRTDDELAKMGAAWIDVRDLGLAHQLALEKEEAGGERLIVSAGTFKWQDFVDAANAISPGPYPSLPKGVKGAGYKDDVVHMISYDVSKAARILGLGRETKYITKEQCTKDSIDDFVKREWKP